MLLKNQLKSIIRAKTWSCLDHRKELFCHRTLRGKLLNWQPHYIHGFKISPRNLTFWGEELGLLWSRLALNLLCRWGWPWTSGAPPLLLPEWKCSSAFSVLQLPFVSCPPCPQSDCGDLQVDSRAEQSAGVQCPSQLKRSYKDWFLCICGTILRLANH